QAALLEKLATYPALRQTIDAWLKAGVVDGGTYLSGKSGISQGGALSPLLMNIALHGMEAVVRGDNAADYALPLVVRYADDFVVLHPDLSELQQAARRIRQWLAKIGLQLNAHKTRIIHTLTPFQGQAGFDFLGFALRQYPGEAGKSSGFQTLLTPTDEASKRHLALISQRLLKLQAAPQAQVIRELNPIIGGWAAYYHGLVSAEAMSRYDEQLEHLLMSWASKRHPNKARDWLLHRYWQRVGKREWIFTAPEGAQLRSYQRSNGQTR
ncbi:MAG: reverse transcriptase domain-containing protein, partial [Chloroflexota bacterium]|nr:reverse transcriptase domain-containing protein [Chloroflexota bacterium]